MEIDRQQIAPEKFENAALFLRLGLPPTVCFSKTLFKAQGFGNADFVLDCSQLLYLRTRMKKRAKRSRGWEWVPLWCLVLLRFYPRVQRSNKNTRKLRALSSLALCLSVNGKYFEKGAFGKRCRHDNPVVSLLEFCSNTNPKCLVVVTVSNSSSVVWMMQKRKLFLIGIASVINLTDVSSLC